MQNTAENSSKQPAIILSGNISEKNFLSIFEELSTKKLSGILKVAFSNKEYRFYFRDGIIAYSENSKVRTDELVLEMIKSSGLITRDTIVKSEGKKSKIMKSLLEILIEEGHVSMVLYSKIISTTVRKNIIEAAFLTQGTFTFESRSAVREVHGVRPVEYATARIYSNISEKKIKSVTKILKNIYYNITENHGAEYLSLNKPFFQNYLITETDFLEYISKAADDMATGGWTFQNKFKTAKVADTALRYLFRTFVFLFICTFLYLATMTTTFQGKKEHRSVKDFYFFKISLLSSLYNFETGETPDLEKMVLNSLITRKEIELSGIENKKEPGVENKPAQ